MGWMKTGRWREGEVVGGQTKVRQNHPSFASLQLSSCINQLYSLIAAMAPDRTGKSVFLGNIPYSTYHLIPNSQLSQTRR